MAKGASETSSSHRSCIRNSVYELINVISISTSPTVRIALIKLFILRSNKVSRV
jgi:hypothetical protein